MPQTAGLDLAAARIATTAAGFIEIDALGRTSAPGCYAIGDVANTVMTSNHALADAAIAVDHIVAPNSTGARAAVPQVVYSALELARIGINQDAAEAQGDEPAIGFTTFNTARPLLRKAMRKDTCASSPIWTGHIAGRRVGRPAAGELIHLVGLEFGSLNALRRLSATAYNHPARAEEIRQAVETLAAKWGLARHVFA